MAQMWPINSTRRHLKHPRWFLLRFKWSALELTININKLETPEQILNLSNYTAAPKKGWCFMIMYCLMQLFCNNTPQGTRTYDSINFQNSSPGFRSGGEIWREKISAQWGTGNDLESWSAWKSHYLWLSFKLTNQRSAVFWQGTPYSPGDALDSTRSGPPSLLEPGGTTV